MHKKSIVLMLFKVLSAAELIKSADDNHYDCDDKASSWITDGWNETNDGACKLRATSITRKQDNSWAHDADSNSSDNSADNNSNAKS